MTTPADIKAIFSSLAERKVTATDIAKTLNISRNTANTRLKNKLNAEDIITIARGLGVNPVDALVELKTLTHEEVFDYLDRGGTLLATASLDQLIYQLAEENLSNVQKIELGATARVLAANDEVAAKRRAKESNTTTPTVQTTTYDPNLHVAYHGDDEDTLRRQQGGHLDDDDYIP